MPSTPVPDDGMPAGWDDGHAPVDPVDRVPDDERIGDRDLAEWPTRTGRRFVALMAHVVTLLGRVWRWSLANLALVVTVLVGGSVVLGATILASEVYDEVVDSEGLAALDRPVLDAAVASRTPASEEWVTRFTDLGGTVGMPVIAVLVVVVLAVRRRSWLPVVLMGIAAAGSVAITVLGKDLAGRARPPVALAVPPLETSPSFPSGHTLNATVVLGVSAYLVMLGRKHLRSRLLVGSVVVVFVVGMGLSRVWLGHHWLTDVTAGWLVGLAWLGTVVTAHRVKVTLDRAERNSGTATDVGPPAQAVPDAPDAVPDTAARPASSRATGTRKGEQET
jgi:undecaprenyl-diphosphatase